MTDARRRVPEPVPGVWQQWVQLPLALRWASVAVPVVVVAAAFLAQVTAGVVVAVLVVGAAAATVTFVKNRSDRINAFIRSEGAGEPDPGL